MSIIRRLLVEDSTWFLGGGVSESHLAVVRRGG